MILPFKQDTLNGVVGAAAGFSDEESRLVDRFRVEICRDAGFIPRNPGDDYPFVSFFAAYLLSPQEPVAGLTWVYATREALRRSVHFTTLRIPLDRINPFAIARSIANGQLKGAIHQAIRDKSFTVEITDGSCMSPVPIDPEARFGLALRELWWLPEAKLLERSPAAFRPFVTFRPAEAGGEERQVGETEKVGTAPPSISPTVAKISPMTPLRREPERDLSRNTSENPAIWRRLSTTVLAVFVSMTMGLLLGKILAQRETPTSGNNPSGTRAEEEGEDPVLLSGSPPHGKALLLPDGKPVWMYGGELNPAGALDPRAPAPVKRKLEIDGSLIRNGQGIPVWELLEDFSAYTKQDLTRQGRKGGETFLVLREEVRSTPPKSGIPGNKPVWLEVQFLKIPRLSGDTIDVLDDLEDNALGWPTEFGANGMSWIRDGQYTVSSPVKKCQIRLPGRALVRPREPFSITAQGVWLSGNRESAFGLALVRGKSTPEEFVLFSATVGGTVEIRERRKGREQTLATTRLGDGGDQEVELKLDFTSAGVSFTISGREVFTGPLDTGDLSRIGLLTCGGQAVGFRQFSIQSRELADASQEHSAGG